MSKQHGSRDNKAIARAFFDRIINQRDLDAVDEIYAESYIHRGPTGHEIRGLAQTREVVRNILDSSRDRRAVVEQQIEEAGIVVTRWKSTATIDSPFKGLPEGTTVVGRGIVISKIENGKIVEDWEMTDFREP